MSWRIKSPKQLSIHGDLIKLNMKEDLKLRFPLMSWRIRFPKQLADCFKLLDCFKVSSLSLLLVTPQVKTSLTLWVSHQGLFQIVQLSHQGKP